MALAVYVLLAATACRRRESDAQVTVPRLVLLYATCTLNKHYLSPYDPAVPFTPHLERFSREAVVFRRHQSEAGQSGTAFAALFSGAQADRHGVFRHPTRLADGVELIGERFSQAGWDVLAWLEHGMASGELGYAQGAREVWTTKLTAEDPGFRAALERLRRDPEARVLLITNFTVTHGPYQPGPVDSFCGFYPDECGARQDRPAFDRYVDFYRRAHAFLSYDFPATRQRTAMDDENLAGLVAAVDLLYRANVSYLDHLFGAVVDEIRSAGLWEESVVAFTADHGETLYREGTDFKWTHGHQLAPEVLGVPFLLHSPGLAAGTWEPVTRSIDVFPTLAGLSGVAPEKEGGASDLQGIDLSGALHGREPRPALRAFSHTSLVAEPVLEASRRWGLFHARWPRIDPRLMWVQVRDGDRVWQLRPGADGEAFAAAFDLATDPWELDNRFDPDRGDDRAVLAELRRYRENLIEAFRKHAELGGEIDRARQEELLKSLSYVD